MIFFIAAVLLPMTGSAESDQSVFPFSGQVVYEDLEGGFWGIITPDEIRYLPIDLPDQYKVAGITVQGTGILDQNITTIQMWGKPLVLDSISLTNGGGPSESAWYQPAEDPKGDIQGTITRMNGRLLKASAALQKGMNSLDEQLSASDHSLKGKVLDDSNLSSLLASLLNEDLGVYESSALDNSGRIIAVAPQSYERSIGSDVSSVPYVSEMLSYPVPTLSNYLRTVEGKNAVIMSYPTFSLDASHSGFISTLIDPSVLVAKTAVPEMNGTQYSVMVMQPDGIILYDADSEEIGASTWTNPKYAMFPGLLKVAAHMQSALAGYDTYEFDQAGTSTPVQKEIVWSTVNLHGTSWRIAVISE